MANDESVFLFVPNVIGYVRVLTAIIAFYYMPHDPYKTMVIYSVSQLLDAVDGHAARWLNQCSRFGAVLDMLTDRFTTAGLLVILAVFYQNYAFHFQCLIALDVVSHWAHVYASQISNVGSHKTIDLNKNPILYYYYQKYILFVFCALNELFFLSVYMKHFEDGPVVQLGSYGEQHLWGLLAYISFPVMAGKQLISVVHLCAACVNIVEVDKVDRAKLQKKR
eukprot:Nk52_evm68s164 gene=Nk52_evmTU68s164